MEVDLIFPFGDGGLSVTDRVSERGSQDSDSIEEPVVILSSKQGEATVPVFSISYLTPS